MAMSCCFRSALTNECRFPDSAAWLSNIPGSAQMHPSDSWIIRIGGPINIWKHLCLRDPFKEWCIDYGRKWLYDCIPSRMSSRMIGTLQRVSKLKSITKDPSVDHQWNWSEGSSTRGFAGRQISRIFCAYIFAGFFTAFYVDSLDFRLSSQLFKYFKRAFFYLLNLTVHTVHSFFHIQTVLSSIAIRWGSSLFPQWENPGVPSRESNSGLPYSKLTVRRTLLFSIISCLLLMWGDTTISSLVLDFRAFCRRCYKTVDSETLTSQNGIGFYKFSFHKKPKLFRTLTKNIELMITFSFYRRIVTKKRDHFIPHLLSYWNIILWCSRCKIHRYLAAPFWS